MKLTVGQEEGVKEPLEVIEERRVTVLVEHGDENPDKDPVKESARLCVGLDDGESIVLYVEDVHSETVQEEDGE